jgi:outer membrane PBP1 activator LpoA protein
VLSRDIYLGALPWVLMQVLLVVIVIFVPQTVTVFLTKEATIDLDSVKIEMPQSSEEGSQSLTIQAPSAVQEKEASDLEQKRINELFNKK